MNEWWVLTSAHCGPNYYEGKRIEDFQVGFGSSDLEEIYKNKTKRVDMWHAYAPFEFTARGGLDDISMIKLKKPLVFSDSVQPACLDTEFVDEYEGTLQITGWG